MADYWKSIPRKFCDFCKCWLTDNKPSVEFHERGRKHQQNVQRKIRELRKKGQKTFQEEKNTERMMQRIEQAALKAFQKDVANNPDMSAASGNYPLPSTAQLPPVQRSEGPAPKPKSNKKQNKKNKSNQEKTKEASIKVWFEAKTEDDTVYYWNCESGDSQWEAPAEGFISLKEQETPLSEPKKELPKLPVLPVMVDPEPQPEPEPAPAEPQVVYNKNPYGSWTPVITKAPKQIDLQLPKPDKKPEFRVVIEPPTPEPEPEIKFKEKVATLSVPGRGSKDLETGFKKRKMNSVFKRNIRQKTEEDD